MAKKKVAVAAPEEEQTTSTPSEEAAEAPAKKAKDPITVKFRDHEGKETERTFSKEVHGDNFAELADEFKTTNASRIVA